MSTLTNHQILGELGWTAQAIYDLSGGFVPKYWRPPYVSTAGVGPPRCLPSATSLAFWAFAHLPVDIFALPAAQGDADNRVRAIAEHVFGLTLVGWNQDSDDWCLNDSGGR